jgi:NAD(P)-dependent dehydrogenase (short-subunit alcohol dehydrogenase family)
MAVVVVVVVVARYLIPITQPLNQCLSTESTAILVRRSLMVAAVAALGGLDWFFYLSTEAYSGDLGQIHASGNSIARLARRLMGCNFYAPVFCYSLAQPHLRASNGKVVILCSTSGRRHIADWVFETTGVLRLIPLSLSLSLSLYDTIDQH